MADYQKMYYTLMDAVERTLEVLEDDGIDASIRCRKAGVELAQGELRCEEIYIRTGE